MGMRLLRQTGKRLNKNVCAKYKMLEQKDGWAVTVLLLHKIVGGG
jgi:hypothetical protein